MILTAIFISIFLFFLSVALLMQNKQDIALSLSMEHKLKAEMAARSVAFEAYGHLRDYGELRRTPGSLIDDDVTTKVELVETLPAEHRGKMLQVRARATSGSFSSYLTLHLLPTELSSTKDGRKVILLPRSEQTTLAVYGDFLITDLGQTFPMNLKASGGPAFTTSPVAEASRPSFEGSIPIFSDTDDIAGMGPLRLLLPGLPAGEETALQWLEYKSNTFEWKSIAAPGSLGKAQPASSAGDTPTLAYEMEAAGPWTDLSALGDDGELKTWSWQDNEPPTSSMKEVADSLAQSAPSNPSPVGPSYSPGLVQHYYVTRGAIAANGDDVYSHGWHYLYMPYRGSKPEEVTPLHGSRVVRWPCVLRYSSRTGIWEPAWNPLRDSGSVASPTLPDPNSLWVDTQGIIYSLSTSEPRRLLTLSANGDVKASDREVPAGEVFLYQDQPHILSTEPRRLVRLSDEAAITFSSLPSGIPGQQGPMLLIPQGESLEIDEAGTNDISPEGAFVIEGIKEQTVVPDYLLGYNVGTGRPFTDGKDLYMPIEVVVEGVDSLHEVFDQEFVKKNRPLGGQVLARYDGLQWHILPHGLRTYLERQRLRPENSTNPLSDRLPGEDAQTPQVNLGGADLETLPGAENAVIATYEGLPTAMPRYAVISITTDPFDMAPDAP